MKETIIILGAGVMQGPVLKIAKELGLHAIALDGSSSAPCINMADSFEQIDLKDKEAIETFARSLQSKCPKLGIMTAGTDFSASVAWTAEKLGLPGIPYETALNASDKSRMRECFKKASLPSPEFFTISENDDIEKIIKDNSFNSLNSCNSLIQFPLVIKPVDNMGSRGCRRVNTIEEFHEAAKTAIGFSRSGRAIVECFMDGPEFSVDAIVYKGKVTICGLADRHIFFPPYFIEMGHTMPTIIEEEKQKAMLETFCAGIKALGISDGENVGAAKGDIKLTTNGPMIGEIAARLSGGYMSGWTYPYSSGALPIKAALRIALGYEPDGIVPVKQWTCAERAFISIPGKVLSINNEQLAVEREKGEGRREEVAVVDEIFPEYINNFFMRIKPGDIVSFPENNVTKCGNVIASAPDRETAIKAAETAARSVLIRLEPGNMETEEFLAFSHTKAQRSRRHGGLPIFPPDAFDITEELYNALLQIPETDNPINFSAKQQEPIQTTEKNQSKSSCGLWLKYQILPFPAFTDSKLTDYMGRTVKETLDSIRKLTSLELTITAEEPNLRASVSSVPPCETLADACTSVPPCETTPNPPKNAENIIRLGKSFWAALIRGSYQGAVYYIDNLGLNEKKDT